MFDLLAGVNKTDLTPKLGSCIPDNGGAAAHLEIQVSTLLEG